MQAVLYGLNLNRKYARAKFRVNYRPKKEQAFMELRADILRKLICESVW